MENDLFKRSLSGIVLITVVVFCILTSKILCCILFSIAGFLMLYEWLKMLPFDEKRPFFLKFVAGVGMFYIIFPLTFWGLFCYSYPAARIHLLLLLVIIWTVDTFAYLGGRLFKGPKLAPSISPNKTWSGAICGVTMAMVVSYAYIYFLQHSVSMKNMTWSLVIAVAGVLGDLLESKVKRAFGVKDTGNIIPGHGGLLDRFDSFLLATYAYYLLQFGLSIRWA